mgnify:FL=1
MKFSEKIYLLRKEAGMTQSELPEALHVSRQSISKWEMGTAMPDMVNIIAISKIFLVSIDYLIHDDIEVRESQKKINLPSHNNKKKKFTIVFFFIFLLLALLFWGIRQNAVGTMILFLLIAGTALLIIFIIRLIMKALKSKESY